VPLFAYLGDSELESLLSSARAVSFPRGFRIFEEGAAADCCFVLTSGRVRVVLSGANGAEILLHIVTPTRLVGEIALLDKSTRSASVVAGDDCHMIRIPASALDALRRNPVFEQRIVTALVSTLREADDRVRVISSFPSINRVAWCLARIARHSGRRDGPWVVIPDTPRQELAEMVGCTRETVSRSLQLLRRRKYVLVDGDQMRLDIDGMQRYLTTELTVANDGRDAATLA
jgi:CRP/FNR family cyclic AMP-dependent transcriptional regulator